jgi:hypothetical protein
MTFQLAQASETEIVRTKHNIKTVAKLNENPEKVRWTG